MRSGYVYFVQAVNGGPIKIGSAGFGGLGKRLATLQNGSPVLLTIRSAIRVSGEHRRFAFELEREIQERFKKYRLHGEWFRAAPELAEFAHAIPDSSL